jgi:hypothetical protein
LQFSAYKPLQKAGGGGADTAKNWVVLVLPLTVIIFAVMLIYIKQHDTTM